mgnify:CR=1 FL=1
MFMIRDLKENDYEQKAYVHYQSWKETYRRLMEARYLEKHTLEKCIQIATRYPENTLVAIYEQKVVGFAVYTESSHDDHVFGEIKAIYVLKEAQGKGIGTSLMKECLNRLNHHEHILVWVLHNNQKSIEWYHHIGFKVDGETKTVKVLDDYSLHEIRMSNQNNSYYQGD